MPEPANWQPIETAPKDVYIDIWAAHKFVPENQRRVTDCIMFNGHWATWIDGKCVLALTPIEKATHWMPSPKPPKQD